MSRKWPWLSATIAVAIISVTVAGQEAVWSSDEQPGRYPFPEASSRWIPAEDFAAIARSGESPTSRAWRAASAVYLDAISARGAAQRGLEDTHGPDGVPYTKSIAIVDALTAPSQRLAGSCLYTSDSRHHMEPSVVDQSTFRRRIRASRAIAVGTVTGIQGGAGDGGLGLLIQVEVSEWIRFDPRGRAAAHPAPRTVHFFYPRGNFQLGGSRICALADGWPTPPEVGTEILVASWLVDPDNPDILIVQSPAATLAFEADGMMQAPEATRSAHQEFRVTELDTLKERVASVVTAQDEASR